jgi:hypothetical protein
MTSYRSEKLKLHDGGAPYVLPAYGRQDAEIHRQINAAILRSPGMGRFLDLIEQV